MVRELSVISLLLTFSLSPLKSAYSVYDYDYNYFKFVKVCFMVKVWPILVNLSITMENTKYAQDTTKRGIFTYSIPTGAMIA